MKRLDTGGQEGWVNDETIKFKKLNVFQQRDWERQGTMVRTSTYNLLQPREPNLSLKSNGPNSARSMTASFPNFPSYFQSRVNQGEPTPLP